jgi:hypothetical protein
MIVGFCPNWPRWSKVLFLELVYTRNALCALSLYAASVEISEYLRHGECCLGEHPSLPLRVLLLEVLQLLTCSCHPLKLDKQLLNTVHIFQGQLFFKVSRQTSFFQES